MTIKRSANLKTTGNAAKTASQEHRIKFPERVWEPVAGGGWCSRLVTLKDLMEREKLISSLSTTLNPDRANAIRERIVARYNKAA